MAKRVNNLKLTEIYDKFKWSIEIQSTQPASD